MNLTIILIIFIFGASLQYAVGKTFKKTIQFKDYIWFIILLSLDFVLVLSNILTANFNAPLIIQQLFKFLTFVNIGLFVLAYLNLLNKIRIKRAIVFVVIVLISSAMIIFYGLKIGNMAVRTITVLSLLTWLFVIKTSGTYGSKYIKTLIYLLIFTEVLRFLIESLAVYEMLFSVNKNIWLSAVAFIIRTLSLLFVVEIHDHTSINSNLARLLDYQSSTSLLSLVFDKHPHAVVLTNLKEEIFYVNPQALENTGYTESEVIGKTPRIFQSGKTNRSIYKEMKDSLIKHKIWEGEFINKKKNGEIFQEHARIVTLKDVNDNPRFYLAIKTDITKEKEYLNKVEYYSNYDGLTGLYRRSYFINLMEKMNLENESKEHYFCLLDIDKFKKINDVYGHFVGDLSLKHFADILKRNFNENAYVCRFGGDEFAIYIYDKNDFEVIEMFEKFLKELNENVLKINDNLLPLVTSIGTTKINLPFIFSDIYDRADKFLYESKKSIESNIVKDY